MQTSIVQARNDVTFPSFMGERFYMVPFMKNVGLPGNLSRWQDTVDQMLVGVDTTGPIYLMIDQQEVRAGNTHRRPGRHIDGYWDPTLNAHRGGHRSHVPGPFGIGFESVDEAIILATNVTATRAWSGEWEGVPDEEENCDHIDVSGMRQHDLMAGRVYAGNVCMIHETMPLAMDCQRTVVRLNVPGWSPAR